MTHSYGNISTVELSDVLMLDAFKKPWSIKKDDILICRDCEFRYICVDCRAYRQDEGDWLSKPLKCNYDPYTATYNDGGAN